MEILLIGAGYMAKEYGKVLKGLNKPFKVFGRGKESAKEFEKEIDVSVNTNGLENLRKVSKNAVAIVAVDMMSLAPITKTLIKLGVKKILLEKPGGKDFTEIKSLANFAKSTTTEIYIAYNRRYYASVIEAMKIIEKDGGVSSFNFEFTEWAHIIGSLKKPAHIKENWLLGNSTHVIDLAFYLGGIPKEISTFTAGSMNWHKRASKFAGAGKTKNNCLFSYFADWKAPGRWGVEIMSEKHKAILRPLEKLKIQKLGSIEINDILIDDFLDIKYKPGLFLQTKEFLANKKSIKLKTIEHQAKEIPILKKILGER
ncbi:MAG: Gfo/Idh/MocA family oxidoreductase [Clostridiales Family XIII bacterium]|jgi:predicted dehydrogenase|nr:Gfo/Idh/MocA family oxidoreductase [Clostridiales Family XIII bacterium]